MTFIQVLTTIFEISMVVALFWCFFHEDRLIAFERRILANIRRRKLKVVRTNYQEPRIVRQ
jgi:hypothetical protein